MDALHTLPVLPLASDAPGTDSSVPEARYAWTAVLQSSDSEVLATTWVLVILR